MGTNSMPLGCPDPCAAQLYHHEIPGDDAPGMKASVGTLGEASPRLQPDPGPMTPPSEPATLLPPLEEPLLLDVVPAVVMVPLRVPLPGLPLEE
jgi:hypothetical protein